MRIIPGCVPKDISIIWPNSPVMGKGQCILKVSCAMAMTVIVVVHKGGARMIDDQPGTKENNFIC